MDPFYVIAGLTWIFSMLVMAKLRSTYKTWSDRPNSARVTGVRGAQAILGANDVRDVRLEPAEGKLSDHYDPATKVIRLSPTVYGEATVSALAIASHEAGHALQHATGYKPLALRSTLAPLAQFGARYGLPAALFGMFTGLTLAIQIGVLAYAGAFLFQLATLPVEFNASRRALENLDRLQLVNAEERQGAKSVLRAAAMTYVAAVASSAGYILYLAMLGGRWLFKRPPVAKPPAAP